SHQARHRALQAADRQLLRRERGAAADRLPRRAAAELSVRKQFICTAALLVCAAAGATGQQPDSARRDSVRVFDPVVVTATRRDERRSNAIVSTLVVSRDDVRESGATNVAGVLAQQLG